MLDIVMRSCSGLNALLVLKDKFDRQKDIDSWCYTVDEEVWRWWQGHL